MTEYDPGVEEVEMESFDDEYDSQSEAIEEYDSRRVGGTDDNPVLATLFRFDDSKHTSERVVISIGRGRKMITTLTKSGNDIKGVARFENHHRSRGWTLQTDIVLFSKDQKELARTSRQRGLRPKGIGSYRRAEMSFAFPDVADKVSYVMVVSARDPSLRYKDIVNSVVRDLLERLIKEVAKKFASPAKDRDKDKPKAS